MNDGSSNRMTAAKEWRRFREEGITQNLGEIQTSKESSIFGLRLKLRINLKYFLMFESQNTSKIA